MSVFVRPSKVAQFAQTQLNIGSNESSIVLSFHSQRCSFFQKDVTLLLTVGSFLLTLELFYLQLAFLLTIGALLLTILAFLLTVGAFLRTVGKCV